MKIIEKKDNLFVNADEAVATIDEKFDKDNSFILFI